MAKPALCGVWTECYFSWRTRRFSRAKNHRKSRKGREIGRINASVAFPKSSDEPDIGIAGSGLFVSVGEHGDDALRVVDTERVVCSWGRDLDFCTLKGEVSPWTRGSMDILYRNEAYQFHVDETCGYLSVDGRQRLQDLGSQQPAVLFRTLSSGAKAVYKAMDAVAERARQCSRYFLKIALFLPY